MRTIKAQALYDLREMTEFCSGTDLHQFFESQTGDPSPAGNVTVSAADASRFVTAAADAVTNNNGDGAETSRLMNHARQIASMWVRS